MNKEQILKMKDECLFPDTCENSKLLETHISWIVLTDHFAFKIKRPVNLPFLDFSTLEKRIHFCNRELELNRRLAPDMYRGVVPITRSLLAEDPKDKKEIIDYAVQMKRMDSDKEMHKMLQKKQVTKNHLTKLAKTIARFHQSSTIVKNAFNTAGMIEEYAQLTNVLNNNKKTQTLIPASYKDTVLQCIEKVKNYLNDNRSFLNDRILNDFQRDCHGDLNATNIFLYDEPVIFDCIEFNDEFRFIDVLNEIAFLCVDLDFYDHREACELFYRSYLKFAGMKEDKNARKLFNFYKSYRANIRAKVTLISLEEHPDDQQKADDAKRYINLMDEYAEQL